MKETIGVICAIIVMLLPVILIVGLIKPTLIIPNKYNVKNRRGKISGGCLVCFFFFAIVGGNLLPDVPKDENLGDSELKQVCDTRKSSIDSTLILCYKPQFDTLYNKLLALDNDVNGYIDRSDYHKKIQNLLYEKWWNAMIKADSTRISLPLSDSEYKKACLLYDKQLARFALYGDEDESQICSWAEENAKKALRKTLNDPNSLIIDDEDIKCIGKTKKGWKCSVIYRAKNSFGGYVADKLFLIMRYNVNEGIYECTDIY